MPRVGPESLRVVTRWGTGTQTSAETPPPPTVCVEVAGGGPLVFVVEVPQVVQVELEPLAP